MILFPDQERLANAVNAEFKKGYNAVLMQAATGSGKSVIASYIIKRSMGLGNVVWFVVPRRELIRQMSETFSEIGIPHSFIADKLPYDPMAKVYIVSMQSIMNKLDRIINIPDRVIIDEVHFGGAGLAKIIAWAKLYGAKILGLSATPNRADGRALGEWFDSMVCGESIKWLQENKRLALYRPFAPDHLDLSMIGTNDNDYNQKQLRSKMESDTYLIGNAVSHYKKHAMDMLGITFAVGVRHSQILAQAYRDAGVVAMHMDGETPEIERKRIARAFALGEIKMLCNAELLTFGYDLASASGIKGVTIKCMMDCQPTKSLPKQMQKWGRNLRYDGTHHLFFDHGNNFYEHGMPNDDREWKLEGREKLKRKKVDKNIVKAMSCTQCHYCHPPAPKCPNCGYEYPITERKISELDAELQEIEEIKRKKDARKEVGMAKSLNDLMVIAKARGYNKGWAFRMAKAKKLI